MHAFPTRAYMIELVRTRGARTAYGPTWTPSDVETIAMLKSLSDAEYATRCGCDHHDEQGNCLGHPREDC